MENELFFGRGFFGRGFCFGEGGFFCVEGVLHDAVEGGGEGNAEEHTEDACESSADGDGCQYPDTGETHGGADDLRIDEVAFQLLEDEDENEEEAE